MTAPVGTIIEFATTFNYFLYLADRIIWYQINHPKELSYEIYAH